MNSGLRIGVFDSGIGGLSVVHAIKAALPDAEIIHVADKENLPYGSKTKEQIRGFVVPILKDLETQCDVIVIACNSVTTLLIKELREILKVPLIGIEPMVKPAAELTKSDIIAVFATPATLSSERYKWLKDTYARGVTVLEPDCSDWSQMIEDLHLNRERIKQVTEEVIAGGADVIVLGCTHYHWIEDEVTQDADGRAIILQPEERVVEQLKRVISKL